MRELRDVLDHDTRAMDHRLPTYFFLAVIPLFLSTVISQDRLPHAASTAVGVVVLLLVAWFTWVRFPSRWSAAAFAAASFVAFLIGNSPVTISFQWLALVVLTLSVSRAVALTYGGAVVAVTGGVHVAIGSGLARTLVETVAASLIVAAGLSLATIILQSRTLNESRRAALNDLAAANAQLEASLRDSRDLVLAQERERVAAALHDGLGHRLTGIGLSLDYSARVLDRDVHRAREEIHRARELTSDALATMRATVRAMRPAELTEGGIRDTLSSLARSFTGTGLTVTFTSAPGPEPDEPTNLLILRCMQEALTNAVRHSGASRVDVTLTRTALTVADDGRGTDSPPSFGLSSLKERARAAGGRLTVDGHGGPGGGVLLTLTLPEKK